MTRTALVTGGASGIGLATVRRLLDDGWTVVAADRDPVALARLPVEDRIVAAEVDVTDERQVEDVAARADQLGGGLSAVVTCAGLARNAPAVDVDRGRRVRPVGPARRGVIGGDRPRSRRAPPLQGAELAGAADELVAVPSRAARDQRGTACGPIRVARALEAAAPGTAASSIWTPPPGHEPRGGGRKSADVDARRLSYPGWRRSG